LNGELHLKEWPDSDHVGDIGQRKSTFGYVFKIGIVQSHGLLKKAYGNYRPLRQNLLLLPQVPTKEYG
jgi:hypothetical protein